jgi:hypothetical protein
VVEAAGAEPDDEEEAAFLSLGPEFFFLADAASVRLT